MSVLDPPKPRATAPTFAEIADEWLQKYPALHAVRPSTMANYTSFTNTHLLPFFGTRPVMAITAEIENFIEAKRAPGGSVRRVGKPLADSALRTGLLALRLILQRAVRRKFIPANPIKEVEWRGSQRTDNVDPFTGPELRAVLSAARRLDPEFAPMLHVWMQTGMRAGEVAGLQWGDLDLGVGTALVQRTWSRQQLGPTKTGRVRTVALTHPVADDTIDWRPGSGVEAPAILSALRGSKVRSIDPEAFVFGGGRTARSSMEVHRAWTRVLLAAKVRYRAPEQLRHTFASTMLSRNAPLLYVQEQGGWRSAAVLLRVYARWMPHDLSNERPAATPAQPALLTTPAHGVTHPA
jgi:integrase